MSFLFWNDGVRKTCSVFLLGKASWQPNVSLLINIYKIKGNLLVCGNTGLDDHQDSFLFWVSMFKFWEGNKKWGSLFTIINNCVNKFIRLLFTLQARPNPPEGPIPLAKEDGIAKRAKGYRAYLKVKHVLFQNFAIASHMLFFFTVLPCLWTSLWSKFGP